VFRASYKAEQNLLRMEDVCVYLPDARDPPYDDAVVDTWFAAGRVVFLERLIDRGFSIERLFALPFYYAVMCIRDEQLRMFHIDMLSRFDDRFHAVDVLFSPWMEDLEPAWCRRIGLTMERLVRDGLSKRHVRQLRLRLSDWNELFGMDEATLRELGITRYGDYFQVRGRSPLKPPPSRGAAGAAAGRTCLARSVGGLRGAHAPLLDAPLSYRMCRMTRAVRRLLPQS
jgi:hypothetical protein